MKRIGAFGIIIFIVMIISVANVSLTAFANASDCYVLHDGVKLYEDETLTSVIKELKQNDGVEVLESIQIGGKDYYKAKVEGVIGYLDANYVYTTIGESCYQLYTAKAYGNKVGGSVDVYAMPNGEVIRSYLDGTVLTVTESEIEGYHVVVMEDGIGYVKDENLTTSISYNERVAIAIALICIVAIILILVITYYRRNSNYYKSKKTSK